MQNASDLAITLSVVRPKVAILETVETVTSKMPATIDAAAPCQMADRGQIKDLWRRSDPARSKGTVMDDYALVLNAGSSSLKFSVYRRPPVENWRLESQRQIEGIGSAPRMSAKDGTGARMTDGALDGSVRDGRAAIASLADWLRARSGGSRVLGVGHRVVHGGPRFKAPTIVTPEVLDELRRLIPLAPLRQPHYLAAIEAVAERLPDVPQVACFDTGFHRGQPDVATFIPLPREVRDSGLASGSVKCPRGSAWRSTTRRTPRAALEDLPSRRARVGLGDPHQRRADDCQAYRDTAWTHRSARSGCPDRRSMTWRPWLRS